MNEKSVFISVYIENKTTKIRLSPYVHITFCTVTFRYILMLNSYVTGRCCHNSVVSECYGSLLTHDEYTNILDFCHLKHELKHHHMEFNGWQLAKMKKSIPDMSLP